MPREEAGQISDAVRKCVMALYPDKKLIFETCGSYRRGKPFQGDVDILVTTESLVDEYNQIKGMLPKIVE